MPLVPLALSPCLPSELLTYVLTHQIYPTSLIVCASRADFLSSLYASISAEAAQASVRTHLPPSPRPQGPASDPDEPPDPLTTESPVEDQTDKPPQHHLLTPTLHQIATSRHLTTVFIPTLSHLRAYLSVFPSAPTSPPPPQQTFDKPGTKTPLLVVYGLVAMHKDTSEWSAQGLGATVAELVEAGARGKLRVVIVEPKEMGEPLVVEEVTEGADRGSGDDDLETMTDDEGVMQRPSRMHRENEVHVWRNKMPMLNGSTRRAGYGTADGRWAGRTVEVGTVLRRWFRLARDDWEDEYQG